MKKFNSSLLITVLVASLVLGLAGSPSPAAAVAMIDLGTASNFAVLAGTPQLTNTGSSVITGDIGLSPATGAGIIGFPPGVVNGTIYAVDAAGPAGSVENAALLTAAKDDLTAAYIAAASSTPTATVGSELGGTTKFAGAYDTADGELHITGTLTLDAEGDPNAVFIFKAASTMTTAASSSVVLINGASACNIFWQIGSSAATLGTNSIFKGNLLSLTSATLTTGVNVEGRILARNGAVTLDSNIITVPTCTTAPAVSAGAGSREGTINVVKTVVNDNGRTKTVADFPLFVNGIPVVSGMTNTFLAPAPAYTVTETTDSNYTRTFSGDCDVNGQIGLNPGFNRFCIVTNDDIGAPVVVPPVPPLIDVVKTASPLALPSGPGVVTYTYTLRNIGTVPVTNVTMVGDTCGPITLTSGDSNNDSRLDLSETWVYNCSTTLTETHTNTVVATGWANGISAVDIASATVIVGAPIVPPLIHVTKIPSPLTLFAGGGWVTYTNKVTNPGTVALSNVILSDNKCSAVQYVSGDSNGDAKLDATETWTYTCRTNLTQTTVNTVIATGDANGLTARDFAIATVVVAAAVPALPDTGLTPAVSAGLAVLLAFMLVAASLIVLRKRAN